MTNKRIKVVENLYVQNGDKKNVEERSNEVNLPQVPNFILKVEEVLQEVKVFLFNLLNSEGNVKSVSVKVNF